MLVIARAAAVCCTAVLAAQDPRGGRVDALFRPWTAADSPGCAVAVIENGAIVHRAGYGCADVTTGKPITPDTPFYIGSTSKQFVAACLLHLERRGELSLDDEVRQHIPQLPDYGEPLTLRHLVYHTSGLRDYLALATIAGYTPQKMPTAAQALELICAQRALNFAPGTDTLYSNSGYFLIAEVVGRVAGVSLREYAQRHLFEPLGMTRSVFKDDPELSIDAAAVSHHRRGDRHVPIRTDFALVGSGGLWSTVVDLAAWDAAFYRDGEWGDLLFRLQASQNFEPGFDPTAGGFACGLRHGHYRGLRTVHHGGGMFGYRAELLRFPDQRFSVICLANTATIDPTTMALQIAEIYLAEHLQKRDPVATAGPRPGDAGVEVTTQFYRHEASDQWIRVDVSDASMRLRALSFGLTLRRVGDDRFETRSGGRSVEVRLRRGTPTELELQTEGRPPVVFARVTEPVPTDADRQAVLGRYRCREVDAEIAVVADPRGIAVQAGWRDASGQILSSAARDRWISADGRLQLEVIRADGAVEGVRLHSPRVRGLWFGR